jgi:penicillin-insensitive murein endopeptidase
MSWKPGELWLDTDLLWFREGAGAPALRGFGSIAPALPALGPPPGLIASRQRRSARKTRRNARRLKAAGLVMLPAAIIPLAASRLREHGTAVSAEDPPSLTFRFDTGMPWLKSTVPEQAESPSKAGADAERAHATLQAEAFPKVEWHHATSVGLPYDGRLINGTQLPIDGPDWVTWNPVTNSVPNAPDRLYGNEHTIRTVLSVVKAYRAAHPDAPRVVVGDISYKGGGPMDDEHVSHQNGLDVDIYYPRTDRQLREPLEPDQIDQRLAQDLVDRFVAAGAQLVLVGPSTGLTGPSGVVIPYANHDNHMHVRFPPPSS